MQAVRSLATDADSSPARAVLAALAARPLLPALLLLAAITALRIPGTVDSDVAWQLWVAGQLRSGADLYRDIVEVNPPLWFWLALPADWLADLLGLRAEAVLVALFGLLAALSLAAASALIELPSGRKAAFLTWSAAVLAAMPWVHVGQREQVALIATLPYAALIAARAKGGPVPAGLALWVGAGAGLGFALKHYFLVVPLLLELWLLFARGRGWRPLRPETGAIAAVGAAYAAALLALEADYLRDVVPLVRLAYGVTGASGLALLGPFALVAVALTGLAALEARLLARGDSRLAAAMLVASAGFAAAYVLQAKGWPYHALPWIGCAAIGVAMLLAHPPPPSRAFRLIAPALLLLPFVLAAEEQRQQPLPSRDLLAAVEGMEPGDSVGFLATESALAWSVTLQHGLAYPSRYMSFWMLRAVVMNEQSDSPDPRLVALGRRIVAETVQDFGCSIPSRIIVSRPRPDEAEFDILPFFLRDPGFARLLSAYRPVSRTTVETYVLTDRSAVPRPRSCRRTGGPAAAQG